MARSKTLQFLALILIEILIGLAVVEVAVRLLFSDRIRGNIILRLTHERPTWVRPDAEFHRIGDGVFHLNFPDGSDGSANRVMIVGDSLAMGRGVGEELRFGAVLQQGHGADVKIDVLGATSYSLVIYSNVVRRALPLARHRAAIVLVDQTDPADDHVIARSDQGCRRGETEVVWTNGPRPRRSEILLHLLCAVSLSHVASSGWPLRGRKGAASQTGIKMEA